MDCDQSLNAARRVIVDNGYLNKNVIGNIRPEKGIRKYGENAAIDSEDCTISRKTAVISRKAVHFTVCVTAVKLRNWDWALNIPLILRCHSITYRLISHSISLHACLCVSR